MPNNQKRILIVEDEKPITRVLANKLNTIGYYTEIAYDGEEALQILKAKSFDLVILDLLLPKVDGFILLAQIKALKIQTTVIVSSNLALEEDIKKAKALGAVDYYVKSDTELQEVVDKIKKYLQ